MDRPNPPPTPPDTRMMTLHLDIARQARALWEGYGCPVGRDLEIWLEAERQILGTDAEARKVAGGVTPATDVADARYPADERSTGTKGEPAAMLPPRSRKSRR